jgi:hypothetical protein
MASFKCFFPSTRIEKYGCKSERTFARYLHEKLGVQEPEFNSQSASDKSLEEPTFKLGYGVTCESISQSAQLFMEREYSDLLQEGFRGVQFIPEIFFSKIPCVIETDESKWTSEQAEALKQYSGFIKGDKAENCLFNKIHQTFCANNCKNEDDDDDDAVLVIHGFKSRDSSGAEGETDFVIVSRERRHI